MSMSNDTPNRRQHRLGEGIAIGTAGHGAVSRGTFKLMEAACREFLDRRGLTTPGEYAAREHSRRRGAKMRKGGSE
jgi:hypothetical protein